MTLLFVLAAALLLAALLQLVATVRCRAARQSTGVAVHLLLALVLTVLAVLATVGALTLRGYRQLSEERPVLELQARILSPQRWRVTLAWPDGATREFLLAGDAFRVEAVVLRWKLPALLAGLPPLYRLDRMEGRYDNAAQEAQSPRSVTDFAEGGGFDLFLLHKRYRQWLPMVDAVYGSGVYLPLVDRGCYSIGLSRDGALVARPDEPTAKRISQPLDT